MKDLQQIINSKAANEAEKAVNAAANNFINAMSIGGFTGKVTLKPDVIHANGEVEFNSLAYLVRKAVAQRLPKLQKVAAEKKTQEFYQKVETIVAELEQYTGELENEEFYQKVETIATELEHYIGELENED